MENVVNLIRSRGLKSTPVRLAILEQFSEQEKAISHSDLEKRFPEFDRVTIYRTLHKFEEKGLIHKVIDSNGGLKYSLCKHQCAEHDHADYHLHFSCEQCDTVICLDQIETKPPILPKGFQLKNYFTLASGICENCAS